MSGAQDAEDAENAVDEGWRAGRDTWPGVHVTPEDYAEYLAAVVERDATSAASGGPPTERAVNGRDLYLACACARADAVAIAAFDRAFSRDIHASAARVSSFAISAEEVRQLVHEKLFVSPAPGVRPKITEFSGRGELRTWVRVVATRVALQASTRGGRDLPFRADALALLVGISGDPEVGYMKRAYTEQLRAAFISAFAGLETRERNLLRYAFVEGLTVDALGSLYKVHRATAARWVARAHAQLSAHVKRELLERLGVEEAEYESILRLVQSQIDITVERYLKDEGTAGSGRG